MTNHPASSIPFYIAIMLERLVYYGTRSVFVICLVSLPINMSMLDAFTVYGWVATILIFSQLGGGLIGLINQPRILTLIGYGIQVTGTIIMGFMQNSDGLIIGFFLLTIGSGLSKTNGIALLAQVYQKSKVLDSAIMINYSAINIGAFLGAFLIAIIAEKFSFQTAFFACAVIMALALILMIFVVPKPFTEKKMDQKTNSYVTLLIVCVCIASALFWLCYDSLNSLIGSSQLILSTDQLAKLSLITSSSINFVVLLITGLVLTIYLTFKRIQLTTFLIIGFGCAIAAVLLLSFILNGTFSNEIIYMVLVGFYVLITFAEIFIGPPITSYILQKVSLMYIPLVIAGYYSLTFLLPQVVSDFAYAPTGFRAITVCLIILGLAFVGFIVMAKMRPQEAEHEAFKDEIID